MLYAYNMCNIIWVFAVHNAIDCNIEVHADAKSIYHTAQKNGDKKRQEREREQARILERQKVKEIENRDKKRP